MATYRAWASSSRSSGAPTRTNACQASQAKWAAMAAANPQVMTSTRWRSRGSWRAMPMPAPISAVYVAWPKKSPTTCRKYHWPNAAAPPPPSGARIAYRCVM